MSGGVDSSVAAALLKKEGFQVEGIFMRLNDFSGVSEKRAKKVAKILDIKFRVLDFRREFKKRIVDYFLKEYKEGRTPNPCVVCNKFIKFGGLLEQVKKIGVDFLATGHYVRWKDGKLFSAKDKNKDQSYFLWELNQDQLKYVLFPIGGYTRVQVENMAKDFKLPFSNVKKSMEVCFVPKTTEEFLKKYLKPKLGNIVDINNKIIGRHKGLPLYTSGQRKGIGLSGGPFYVIDKNPRKNELIVSKNKKDLLKKEIFVKEINWILNKEPKFPLKVQVKIRYRTNSVPARIYKIHNNRYKIIFTYPQRAATPGQSAVFYGEQELLGGGIIC